MSLRELQTAFAKAIFHDEPVGIAPSLTEARGMAIYRNNVYAALTEALQAIYPVILRLVGEEFFEYASRCYIDYHPSTSGDLNDYGAHYGEFLQGFRPAASLPYLPDTARLEWCCHHAYLAADEEPLDLHGLAAVKSQDYGKLRWHLARSVSLLSSPWPVHDIWRVHQDDHQGELAVNLDQGGVKLLIQRHDATIVLHPLSAAEWALLSSISQGLPFAQACNQVLLGDPSADVSALLQKFITQHTLAKFSLAT